MTRVFRNREEAEAAGWRVYGSGMEATRNLETSRAEWADVRSPLECTLADALEAVEWMGWSLDDAPRCPSCRAWEEDGHAPDCKLSLALKAFRGEGERG